MIFIILFKNLIISISLLLRIKKDGTVVYNYTLPVIFINKIFVSFVLKFICTFTYDGIGILLKSVYLWFRQ